MRLDTVHQLLDSMEALAWIGIGSVGMTLLLLFVGCILVLLKR